MQQGAETGYPATPQLDRAIELRDKMQEMGAFLEWMCQEHDVEFCRYYSGREEYVPIRRSINDWLALYFDIDQRKMDDEQRAIIAWIRSRRNTDG
jgi:hypothetical protein